VQHEVLDYAVQHTTPPHPILDELERYTHLHTLSPQMLSGPYQGMLLSFITQMVQPRRILEVGAFTGYTAICMAQYLPPDGEVHTIEVNDEHAYIIQKFVEKAGLTDKVKLYIGDAATVIPVLNEIFDLVFLDAGKLDYSKHYELALSRTRSGGFILADNILWDGKVLTDDQEATTVAIRNFNKMVHEDTRVDNLLLPLRDGLMVIRKK
jgi:predicted O-methyltransferase YrrM